MVKTKLAMFVGLSMVLTYMITSLKTDNPFTECKFCTR